MTRKNGSDEERGMSLLAIDQYMRQVSWIPVATKEECQQLAVRIERGKVEKQQDCPDAAILADAKAARDRLIEGMQRLVIFMAGKWLPCFRGMDFLDLVQEANEGLLRMIDHRDLVGLEEGLSAAVSTAIRYHLLHVLDERDSLMQTPRRVPAAVRRLRSVRWRLLEELGRTPTQAELAQELGVSVEQVRAWEVDASRLNVVSLQGLVEREGEKPLEINFVSLFQQEVEMDRQRQEALEAMVREAVETTLTGRQREVVTRWYGLDHESQSMPTIAQTLGIAQQVATRAGHMAEQKLAVYLAVPYGMLCGHEMESKVYTVEQAAAALGLSRHSFNWLVRKGQIKRVPESRERLACYARADVERLAASREEWSA